MLALEIPAGALVALACVLVPLAAGFFAWVVRELSTVSRNNAVATEALAELKEDVKELRQAVFAPAWSPTKEGTRR
jgi:hypothetical protein